MTTPHTITIVHTIEPSFLWDIMTTAVESSYEWFGFSKVVRQPAGRPEHALAIMSFTAHELDENEDNDTISKTEINEAKIVEAITKILAGGKCHVSNMNLISAACAENDASNIDMDLADCILQVACFDEIRYG